MNRSKVNGFTLIEVLVAVSILVVGVGGIIKALGQTTSNLSYLQEKTFAHWVAQNALIEVEMGEEITAKSKTEQGSEELAGVEWFWQAEITEEPDMLSLPIAEVAEPVELPRMRIEVSVRRSKEAKAPIAIVEKVVYL
ncbi:MAG: type II secretion system protein GspI [Kangiellaceae bacterium]|nr:type II secretion system protein GspI [Kangiellaceae bacterium]|tara:strand:- start:8081 stop:8494 length:414 start_codon:yes stop_codon:yes gene_type:complete